MYTVIFSPKAEQDLKALKKSEPQAYKKPVCLFKSLQNIPQRAEASQS